ncbi:hypothetical protein CCH79_00019483, partial [Gambusia affinis]
MATSPVNRLTGKRERERERHAANVGQVRESILRRPRRGLKASKSHKGFQRFEALEQSDLITPGHPEAGQAPRQRFLFISIAEKKVTLYSYNWSVDLGASLNRELVRLVKWQNARAHVVHCLFNQKMGLFHHYCFSDPPLQELDSKLVHHTERGPNFAAEPLNRIRQPQASLNFLLEVSTQLNVRFDIWEQGNISPLQLSDKLQGALRHALCDAIMELRVLRNPLCLAATASSDREQREGTKGQGTSLFEKKDSPRQSSGSRIFKSGPSPITLIHSAGVNPLMGTSTPESTTPTSKISRRSFWDILSKPDSAELGSPKTTDDIVQEKGEEGRAARRRHKTENVKQQWSQERAVAVELEQAQRRQLSQLEEGDAGTLHPVYQDICQSWITFMARLAAPVEMCFVHSLLSSTAATLLMVKEASFSLGEISTSGTVALSKLQHHSKRIGDQAWGPGSPTKNFCCWIMDFLRHCSQRVVVGSHLSSALRTSTGYPQGYGTHLTKLRCKPFPDASPICDCA